MSRLFSGFCSRLPLMGFMSGKWRLYRSKAEKGVQNSVENVRHFSFRGGLVGLIMAMIVWISIFLYVAFYYAYIPSISHVRPVHVQYNSRGCEDSKGVCSYPYAQIQLTQRQQLLMVGQPYKIYVQLDMPESPANKALGMFMVCGELLRKDKKTMAKACRSAMLHYRSPLLEILTTLTLSPLMVLGQTEEKQSVIVELFSDFEDDQNHPVTDVMVEIRTSHVELYSATILIHAHFTGLRYLMFHWPILSATVGISSNLFFILLIFSMSWWHLSHTEESDGDLIYISDNEESIKDKDFKFEGEVETKDEEQYFEDRGPFEDNPSLSALFNPSSPELGKIKTDSELSSFEEITEPGVQEVPK